MTDPNKDVVAGGDVAHHHDPKSLGLSDRAVEELAKDHKPNAWVEQVEDRAKDAGDPYFGEYAEDPDDDRASEGTRTPHDIDGKEVTHHA